MRAKYRHNGGPAKTAFDLFCGSGSVTAALKTMGFRVAAAVDNNFVCARTYRANHPDTHFFASDIRKLEPWHMRRSLPPNRRLDLLIVCAPCQPFSNQNRFRNADDDRLDLVLSAVKFIQYFRPTTIIFENVPGIERSDSMVKLLRRLRALGYLFSKPEKLDAADFGVPQRRLRCLLVASKDKEVIQRTAKLGKYAEKRVTVRDALQGVPSLLSGEKSPTDQLHLARGHSALNLERLRHIPKNGGNRHSLPEHLVLECHKKLGAASKFPDVYGRMAWDDVAPTLTTGCTDITRGRYAHPEDDRAITLREAARIQTFPDTYQFHGNHSQIATQIGNAVPMKMMVNVIRRLEL